MKLEGIHHITAITGDAPRNVDFYTRVIGLRLVKKTRQSGRPVGLPPLLRRRPAAAPADLTFFEYPGARAGAPGAHGAPDRAGASHPTKRSSFWEERLADEGVQVGRPGPGALRFQDPEGLEQEILVVDSSGDDPADRRPSAGTRRARAAGLRRRARLQRRTPSSAAPLLEQALAFEPDEDGWEIRGSARGGTYAYDPPPDAADIQGAGTIHHVAWASPMDDHEAWRESVLRAGGRPTPVIDRFYFRSVYFREPSGVLFEIATIGPGFATTSRRSHSGRSSRCRRTTSTCASRSSGPSRRSRPRAERSFPAGCAGVCGRRLAIVSPRSGARKLAPERSGRTRREAPRDPRAAARAYATLVGRLGGGAWQTIARAICSVWGRDLRPRSRATLPVYRRRPGRARAQRSLLAHGRTTVLTGQTRATPTNRTYAATHAVEVRAVARQRPLPPAFTRLLRMSASSGG